MQRAPLAHSGIYLEFQELTFHGMKAAAIEIQ
jgi:hypothetical protein